MVGLATILGIQSSESDSALKNESILAILPPNIASTEAINLKSNRLELFWDSTEDYSDLVNPSGKNFSDEAVLWWRKDSNQVCWRSIIVCFIMLFGILGNTTIIYSICKHLHFRSRATNIFILNMAIADLFTTIFCPLIALIKNIYQFYVLGDVVCHGEGFIKITFLFLSSYALIMLALDWLICIAKPCRKRISTKQAWVIMAIIWVISLSMGVPLAIKRQLKVRKWEDVTETWCQEAIHEYFVKYYWITVNLALIYYPTLCMTITLVIILIRMRNFERKLEKARLLAELKAICLSKTTFSYDCSDRANNTGSLLSLAPMKSLGEARHSAIKIVYRRKIMKILFAYLLTSIICWTPLQVTIIYRLVPHRSEYGDWFFELIFFSELSVAFSAAMNPIIFGFLSRPYRRLIGQFWLIRFLSSLAKLVVGGVTTSTGHQNHNYKKPNTTARHRRNQKRQVQDHEIQIQLQQLGPFTNCLSQKPQSVPAASLQPRPLASPHALLPPDKNPDWLVATKTGRQVVLPNNEPIKRCQSLGRTYKE